MSRSNIQLKAFTPSEDQQIVALVSKQPQNLTAAFEELAKGMGRTRSSVTGRWYGHLKHNSKALSVLGAAGVHTLENQKNAKRDLKNNLDEEEQLELITMCIKKMSREGKKRVMEVIFQL